MSDLSALVQLQFRVAAFLADQPGERLLALIEGRASLALLDSPSEKQESPPAVDSPPTRPASPEPIRRATRAAPTVDAEAVAAQLRQCRSVDEAAVLLKELNLKAVEQQHVARALGVTPKGTKPEVARQIINQAVGARLKYASLRQG